MKKILINYADQHFYQAQQKNSQSGREVARFDQVISYGVEQIAPQYRHQHQAILQQRRGAGYWLWKPYFILQTLQQMSEGDVLFYSDSGAHFVTGIEPLVARLEHPSGILLFTLEDFHTNKCWTKRDCFYYMGLDTEPYLSLPQILASFIVCKKTSDSMDFFARWLRYAEDPRILTDAPNSCGLPDYPEFRDHRHDQSILSLLARQYQLNTVADISQWGNERREPDIPQILQQTRWKA